MKSKKIGNNKKRIIIISIENLFDKRLVIYVNNRSIENAMMMKSNEIKNDINKHSKIIKFSTDLFM